MIKWLKKLDSFTRNVVIVFLGTSLANFFNLLYQLLIAHRLSAIEFAAFNSLLSLFMVIASPLGTIQTAIAKYSAQFYANNQIAKLKFLLTDLFKKTSILAVLTFLIFSSASGYIIKTLKIPSASCGYILAGMFALSWLAPLLAGGVQGLELFGWLSFGSIVNTGLKLALAFIFILLGFSIAGALGAFLIASLIGLFIYYFPLRRFICLPAEKEDINPVRDIVDSTSDIIVSNGVNPVRDIPDLTNHVIVSNGVNYKEILVYLFPVAISNFCFISLVNFDMVMVKYFFTLQDSGLYSLAQVAGKIFLFLPGAISIVMFPRISGLNAKKMDTSSTLRRSLLYVLGLCVLAAVFYNLYPSLVLKALTGKVYPGSIMLGRLFSISMSFFTLLYIFIANFLSLKDFRFIKYLVSLTILQFLAIGLIHKSLFGVQLILCINSILLFSIHYLLAASTKKCSI